MANARVILISGASTGIGLATAKLLAAQGHMVFGTSRQPENMAVTDFTLLRLDVNDDASVTACIEAVLAQVGRIDVLVNNAGVSLSGAVEEASIEDAKRLFETNFFGVLRMVNAVLPVMRQQRSGHIINISSLAGIMGVPYIGLYSASKHALEGYSEALRYEVKPFGIRVALVEPGDTRTDIAINTPAPEHSISDYNGLREQVNAMHSANVANGTAAESIARAIAQVVDHPRPGLRKPITKGLEIFIPLARRFLPYFLTEPGIRDHYKLDG